MEKPEQPKTVAQTLFSNHEILTKRPDNMEFKEYWVLRYMQNKIMKKMFPRCPDRKLIGIIPGLSVYRMKRLK